RPTDGRQADEHRPLPGEVLAPPVLTRVVDPSQVAGHRIDAGEVRAFVQVAVGTGQGKVRGLVGPLVLLGDAVIDQGADWQGGLRELAVCTPVPGPPPDSSPEIIRHGAWFARLSESRALDWRTASS